MSKMTDSIVAAIRSSHNLVVVQSDEFIPVQVALIESNAVAQESAVLTWDPEDGFLPVRNVMDELPQTLEIVEALEVIEKYQGNAFFILDATQGSLVESSQAVRPRLKQLVLKTAVSKDLFVVIVTNSGINESIAKLVHWIGESPVTENYEKKSSTKGIPEKLPWKDLQTLRQFDTLEWRNRIEQLSSQEVAQLVESNYHRDSLERINELKSSLKQRFAQKEEIIDAVCSAAVAQVPCVLMGPPGTAKGHLIRSFCEGLGLTRTAEDDETEGAQVRRRYFEYQLTRFTTPEELFGPVHVQDLIEKQTYHRITDGYLPSADIAFLDELFKASSAILNTLLSILNERIFYNEGRAQKIPLTTIFAASNEPPQEESLEALFDRFPIRINCPPVENNQLAELHARSWEDSFDRHFSESRQGQQTLACANDLRLLKKVSFVALGGRQAPGTQGAFEKEFIQVFRMLRREASISDRSLSLLYAYARASALLANRKTMTADDLDVFRKVVWGQEQEFEGFFRQLKKNYRT